jgi:hypothetical protein
MSQSNKYNLIKVIQTNNEQNFGKKNSHCHKQLNDLYVMVKIIVHRFVYVSKCTQDLFIANSIALCSFERVHVISATV